MLDSIYHMVQTFLSILHVCPFIIEFNKGVKKRDKRRDIVDNFNDFCKQNVRFNLSYDTKLQSNLIFEMVVCRLIVSLNYFF